MNISRMKYALLTLVALILSVTHVSAQIKWNSAYQAYIDQYKDLAIEQMLKYNIPASITLSQGLLESGAGRSWLTKSSNNHFGIKCHGWTGRRVFHDDDERGDASEHTTIHVRVSKTTAVFLQRNRATLDCSTTRAPTTRVGHAD